MVAEVFFEFRDPGISMGNVIQLWEISLEDPRFLWQRDPRFNLDTKNGA